MKHIVIRVIPIVNISWVFNEFYEIIRNEYSDFWRKAIFTRSRTVVLNDCGIKIHFVLGDNELLGVDPYREFELNYPDHTVISELAYDIVTICRALISSNDDEITFKQYCENDIKATKEFLNRLYGTEYLDKFKGGYHVYPKKVIFNKPATIVIWNDGIKTVVKCQKGDRYDPEKGLAMAYVKRLCGLKEFYKSMELGGK
ncbi:MAG: hypothetical protein IKP88_06370 [Lachnospiraceae bacterium]|nr:hypothetical protein [Lachnospiraceae bacterium]